MTNEIYKQVNDEITNLHYIWLVFKNVYGANREQIELLNKVDNEFFGVVQDLYWDSLLLNLSRLTDKEIMGRNRNLSLYTIYNDIESEVGSKIKDELQNKLDELKNTTNNIRTHRSKRIAHNDYKSIFNDDAFKINGISRNNIENVLSLIRDFMRIITNHFDETEIIYDQIFNIIGGKKLLRILQD